MKQRLRNLTLLTAAALMALPAVAPAQTAPPAAAPSEEPVETAASPVYKPPLRGAPGGRVGGASRSAVEAAGPLPEIELLAPSDHAGLTASATPMLLFYVSQPVQWPTQLTISAPSQAAPVLEATIPSPGAAGIYAVRPNVRLRPGIPYTWSVSIVLDPHAWSHNIVASGTVLSDPSVGAAAALTAPPLQRAARFADAGVWYDAVAAAADAQSLDRHAALDALIKQAGLPGISGYVQPLVRR